MRRVTLGRVAGVYGVRGEVRVQSYTRPVSNLAQYRNWWIAHGEGFDSRLVEVKPHGAGLVAKLNGPDGSPITDRDLAASLIGAEIQVDRDALPEPEEGEYYWFDLVGLEVRSIEGELLGRVDSLTSNGAQDVLVVQDGDQQRLIPFVQGPIIESVDLDKGLITAHWQLDY